MVSAHGSWIPFCMLVASIAATSAQEIGVGTRTERNEVRREVVDTLLRMRIVAAVLDTEAAEADSLPAPTSGITPVAWLRAHIDPRHRKHLESGRDAWGHAIRYWSDGRSYMLVSLGSDEVPQFDYSRELPFEQIPRASTGPDPTNDLIVVNGIVWRGPASWTETQARSAVDVRSIGSR